MYRGPREGGPAVAAGLSGNYKEEELGVRMGIARSVLRGLKDKVMSRYGEKIVSSLGDTSSDAPNKFSEPKRNLYDELERDGKIDKKPGDNR